MDLQTHGTGLLGLVMFIAVFLLGVKAGIAAEEPKPVFGAAEAILHVNDRVDPEWAKELGRMITEEFEEIEVDPLFGVALCFTESSFNPMAFNKISGCTGLFQIHPVHGEMCTHDPSVNVRAGASIFARYLDRADGDYLLALQRYGQGQARFKTIRIYDDLVEKRMETDNGCGCSCHE